MAKRSTPKTSPLSADSRIVVFHGKDAMRQRLYLQQLREKLEEAHGRIETIDFDGKTVELAEVLDELRGYSLLQQHKLVVVDEAEPFIKTNRQALERYAAQPVDHATLVLRPGSWQASTKLGKAIDAVGAVVACEPPTEGEAVQWVMNRARHQYGRLLEKPAAQLMVDRLGVDLARLESELSKITLLGQSQEPIREGEVAEHVGKSSDEQAWAAQEAVLQSLQNGSSREAIAAIHELIELANQPAPLVMYFVADLMRKLVLGAMMRRAGISEGQLMKQLKVFGPRQRPFAAVLRRLDEQTLRHLLHEVVQWDARAKTGLGEPVRNMQRFCVQLVDDAGPSAR